MLTLEKISQEDTMTILLEMDDLIKELKTEKQIQIAKKAKQKIKELSTKKLYPDCCSPYFEDCNCFLEFHDDLRTCLCSSESQCECWHCNEKVVEKEQKELAEIRKRDREEREKEIKKRINARLKAGDERPQ